MVDRRTLDRDATERTMRASLQLVDQWHDFQKALPSAATGDAVMIACVPDDRLSWIFEQMSDHDAVGLCALGPVTTSGRLIRWSFVVGEHAVAPARDTVEPLAAAGPSGGSTVSEFMHATASSTGELASGSVA